MRTPVVALLPCSSPRSRWLQRAIFLVAVSYFVLGAAACEYVPILPTELADFYVTLQHDAERFPRHDGEWEQHSGDAPFYGTAFYVRAGTTQARPDYQNIAAESRAYCLKIVRQAATDRPFFLANLEEVMMAALGLVEYTAQTGDPSVLPDLEDFIETINSITVGLGRYIDIDAGKFAIQTYGPTAITASIALLNLQYATYVKTPQAAERIEFARQIVDTIDQKARFGDGYRVKPGEDLLELYPNTMMMLVLARLYQLTDDEQYLGAAKRVFSFIQPLRNRDRGGYNSPYSAAMMGATTDDYSTLSSQNYLTLALFILFQDTGDGRYFDEAKFVLTFIRERLYDPAQGKVLHHFIDGHIAAPSDPEYFCSGCNLQLLYVLWYARHYLTYAE